MAKKQTKSGKKLPNSWMFIGMGFSLLILAGVVVAALALFQVENRTRDMRAATTAYIEATTQVLKQSRVPEDIIKGTAPTEQADDNTLWTAADYEIQLPQSISATGLATVLKDWGTKPEMKVAVERVSDLEQIVTLSLFDRQFAKLKLVDTLVQAPSLRDISLATNRISDEALTLLNQFTTPALRASIGGRARRESETLTWTTTDILASAELPVDIGAVMRVLNAKMADRDVTLTEDAGANPNEAHIQFTYEGVDIAKVTITSPQGILVASAPYTDEAEPGLGELSVAPTMDGTALPEEATEDPMTSASPTTADNKAMRVAIVIDDGGRAGKAADAILALDTNLTLAILPYEPQSTEIAERAKQRGFEVILHMPMEPFDGSRMYPDSITTQMTDEEIIALTEKAFAQVPQAVGVNNHEGSRFTSFEHGMDTFLSVVKQRPLYFLDSRTTPKTVAFDVAVEMQIPATKRDVFLDNKRDIAHISEQFERLIEKAKEQDTAVAIGHFSEVTAQALQQLLPRLQAEGISLVHASEFTR